LRWPKRPDNSRLPVHGALRRIRQYRGNAHGDRL
jgi:hypothetical protein